MTDLERSAQIAGLIAARRAAPKNTMKRVDSTEPAPLSRVQLGLWLSEMMHATGGATNRPTAARLIGPLDSEVLRVGLEGLLERHEPLRTVYPMVGEEPIQQVVDSPRVDLQVLDISAVSPQEREIALDNVMREAAGRKTKLDSDVAFHAVLLVESADSHVLVVGLSHIAFDGWSEGVFWADLLELYRSGLLGVDPQLPDLKIRFRDYARWERAETQPGQVEDDLAYWRESLAGLGEAPSLPRAADAGGDNGLFSSSFDGTDMVAVRRLAREQRTTPFVVLLTAFQLLLRELLDAEDFVISCPVAGRDRPETHDLISCFINPLLVRSSLGCANTRLDLLLATRVRVADSLAHREASYRDVIRDFGSWGRRPNISNISFQWRDFPPRPPAHDAPITIEPMRVPVERRGLHLYVTPSGEGAHLEAEFAPQLIGLSTVSDWCVRLREHLRSLCADPNGVIGPLRQVSALPDPQADLAAQSIERVTYSVKRHVDLDPDSLAVQTPGCDVSYRQLWARSGAVATGLMELGVRPGDPVSILTNRNAGYAIALLGVLRAGGVAVPLDAQLPSKRITLMASTASTEVAVVVDDCGDLSDTPITQILHVDSSGQVSGLALDPMEQVDVEPSEDQAYIFFTSGTSGTPKAVLGTHLGLSHLVSWERSRIGISPADRVAGITGPSFDVSLRELFLPLTSGAVMTVAPETIRVDKGLEWLATSGATVLHITPSLAGAWMTESGAAPLDLSLRWTLFAGEPLTDAVVDRWCSVSGSSGRIMNFYGPTETCMVKAGYEVNPEPRKGVQPVGYALPFSQLLVVAHGEARLCEPGEPGEVLIRTSIGTSGYLASDQGGFVENPLAPGSGDIVYRTGDVGWYEPDWAVTVQGRVDDQLKIDGIRVEPAETESFLNRHENVRQCAVFGVEHDGVKQLEAFVVHEGEPTPAGELRKYLHQWLRAAAIPPLFHTVAEIPLTANNKTDRRALLKAVARAPKALQAPGNGLAEVRQSPDPDQLEETVAQAWREVLAVEQLSGETDFFVAGGTSLRALRILARLDADLGIRALIDLFFDHPTLSDFTAAVAELFDSSASAPANASGEVAVGGAPLSFMQETMWAESQLSPGSGGYELNRVFDISGPLQVAALGAAVGTVVGRHEVLRTRLRFHRGEPRADIMEPGSIRLEQVDLGAPASGDPDAALDKQLETYQEVAFDLVNGPLIRFVLFRLDDQRHCLLIRGHHMILDGWSLKILTDELSQLYNAQVAGTAPDLPTLEIQYSDFAIRQRTRDREGLFDEGLDHWHSVLSDPPPDFAMTDKERPDGAVASDRYRFEVDTEITESMAALAKTMRVTPFMLGLSLWSAFMSKKVGQSEIIVGVPVADRGWSPSTALIGVFLNTLPMRVAAGGTDNLADLAKLVRGEALAAFQFSDIPLERVFEVAAPERRRSRTPLFRVMFQYHHDETLLNQTLHLEGLQVKRLSSDSTGTSIDVYLSMVRRADGATTGSLQYDPRLMTADEVVVLADQFQAFAREAVSAPELRWPEVTRFGSTGGPFESAEVPLSFAQERMWFIEQLEPGTPQFAMAAVRRVQGPLDIEVFERALNGVVERHGVLRTRIVTKEGKPHAFIDPPLGFPLGRHDLRSHPPEQRQSMTDDFVTLASGMIFDLSAGALMRADAVRLGDDEWLLVFAFHHIVMDAMSYGIFFHDLGTLYAAGLVGDQAPLADLDIQYWEFAAWQRDRSVAGGYDEQLDYWERILEPPLPSVTVGTPTPGGEHQQAVQARRPLPDALADRFQKLAAELRVTPYMLCLAIWAGALCDETGGEEVLTAAVSADRAWPPTERLVGYFVNTLPLRLRVESGASLVEVVASVRMAAIGVYGNGAVPLDLILERVRPNLSVAASLVNGVEISLQEPPSAVCDLQLHGTVVTREVWRTSSVKFDLHLGLVTGGPSAAVTVKGRASLICQQDADLLAERFLTMAQACLTNPSQPLRGAADSVASSTDLLLVPQRAADVAQNNPEQVVIEAEGRAWTAAEFDRHAVAIAAQLRARGVGPGDRVLLAAQRSPLAIAAMYGIWKVGAAYVPVEPTQPESRTAAIIEDCEPALILTDLEAPRFQGAPVLQLHDELQAGDTPAAVAPDPQRAAYVIYTSGSTGRPKGVVVSHGALATFVDSAVSAYGLGPDDRVLQFHSLAFDSSVEEIHVSLARGVTLVLPDVDLLGSARRFLDFVEQRQLSVVSVPTAFWHELVRQAADTGLAVPSIMRTLIIGGEAARPDLVQAWHALGSNTQLINSYGPTEATVVVFTAVLGPTSVGEHVSIGHPLPGVQAAILDPTGAPVVGNDWGELLVGGPQLATGYLGLAHETATAFVTLADGDRWYRTGDRARRRPDGEFEISGRFDDQVKIAGHRIEPGEVERTLRGADAIADVAVVVVPSAEGSPTLAGFVVLEPGHDRDSIGQAAATILPDWMVPSEFHLVDELPRTAGAKIDKFALRERIGQNDSALTRSMPVPNPAAPDSAAPDTVRRVAALWCELLGLEQVSETADFFELGGRSLTAVRLTYLIENEFGVSLPVVDIFDTPTVVGLSASIDALGGQGNPVADAAPSPSPPDGTVLVQGQPRGWPAAPVRLHLDRAPLSYSQQRIWLHQELRGDHSGYAIRSAYRLRGHLDLESLSGAVHDVVGANEVLRSRVVRGPEGRPSQHIDAVGASGAKALLVVHDLGHLDPQQRVARSDELQAEFAKSGFDLSVDHPFRVLVIALGPDEHLLTLLFHHLAVDGHGIALVLREIGDGYESRATGSRLDEPHTLQFSDFAVWQRARLRDGAEDVALTYWRDKLRGVESALELPGRRADAKLGGTTETVHVDFSQSVGAALSELAGSQGVSPFQLVVALLNVLFHRLTGSEDIVLGTPSTERRSPELEHMVGLFVNTIVLRSRVTPGSTFGDVLKEARGTVGAALDNGGVPFDALIDDLRIPRQPDRLPLVSVLCAPSDGDGSISLGLAGIDIEGARLASSSAAGSVADLMVHSGKTADGRVTVTFQHDRDVLDPWVVRQMATSLEVLAAAVVKDPDAVVGGLPIIGAGEQAWLATGLNQNTRPFPENSRLEATFAQVVSDYADETAVEDARRRLTYQELMREAVAFAAVLSDLGAGPGSTIGVRLERSVELAVALVAVLHVGAVYVPIDAHSPESRSQEMLDQAGAAVVVSALEDGTLHAEAADRPVVQLPELGDDQPAYVMFTSGSTGRPKGAVISHRAVQRTVQNIDYTTLGPSAVVAMASNPAFDALTFEVWGALLTGARLVVVDMDTLTRPSEFAVWLRDSGITTMFLTTSLANLTVAAEPDAFCTLDTLIVGGEAVDVGTMRSLVQSGPRRLVNGYGPTECTTFSVWHEITDVPADATSIPIGGPVANTQLYVLDEAGTLVPRGFDGELCIAGPGLAMGYVGDVELTDERFVQVNIVDEPVRVYRTGDMVRRSADGTISYLGRRDHQIKLRGFRIELGEIEAALCQDEAVVRAAVREFGEGTKRRLVGYVVGASGRPIDVVQLRHSLGERIPEYMVPAELVELDAIPLTESAKIDRRALLEPTADSRAGVHELGEEPVDEIQRVVLVAWSDALQAPSLDLDADFFATGGNSLLGVELLAAIENHFGIALALSTLFNTRTPRQFAALVRTQTVHSARSGLEHVVTLRSGDGDSVPLWLIHPAGGSLVLYEPMVSEMSAHHRILGVEAAGLDGSSEPLSSVDDLADHQLQTILRVQPHGPYRIVGYSIGGVVGLELARRLMARGERVELVGAIEAGVPSGPTVLLSRRRRYGALLRRGNVVGMATLFKDSLGRRAKRAEERLQIVRNKLDRAHKAVLDNMVHAFENFEPSPLAVNMTLFFGSETSDQTAERLRTRWASLATDGIVVRRVSGSHENDSVLREAHAPALAAAIEAALDDCDRSAWS